MGYEGLNITKITSNYPIAELYSHPIGKTIILIKFLNDSNIPTIPVLFDGPVCGEHHFLEARQREGILEIVSRTIPTSDLNTEKANRLGLFSLFSKDKEANKQAGFIHIGLKGSLAVYNSNTIGYDFLLQKVNAVGLVDWAKRKAVQKNKFACI